MNEEVRRALLRAINCRVPAKKIIQWIDEYYEMHKEDDGL